MGSSCSKELSTNENNNRQPPKEVDNETVEQLITMTIGTPSSRLASGSEVVPNQMVDHRTVSRTIIVFDATGSMIDLLQVLQATIAKVIGNITDVLGDRHDLFEIQLVAYRNYSSHPNELLEISPWASTVQPLIEFVMPVAVWEMKPLKWH